MGFLQCHACKYDYTLLSLMEYRVSRKKGYPLKSSANAACSNLNALTP